jgi:hypothetical protein
MQLAVDADDNVTGSTHWTLRKSPEEGERGKIGLTGVEHSRGIFLPNAGLLRLEGTSLDDPNTILAVDRYRLILSDDARVLGGITWHEGAWTGQMLLEKK